MRSVVLALALLILSACGGDAIGDGPAGAPDGATTIDRSSTFEDLVTADLSVEDSCGRSFVMRDRAGLVRLTVTAPLSGDAGLDSGWYPIGNEGWTAQLEVGARLTVWPCHDVGTDFDTERVDQVLAVVAGDVELLDRIPPAEADGGGVGGKYRAWLRSPVVQLPNGSTAELGDVELVSSAWGFWGG
jgi:hypothetical protein